MAPQLKQITDLTFIHGVTLEHEHEGEHEERGGDTNGFKGTAFGVVDPDDHLSFGRLPVEQSKIPLQDFEPALQLAPDANIYVKVPDDNQSVMRSSGDITSDLWLKRPRLDSYQSDRDGRSLEIMRGLLAEEAEVLEKLAKLPPHPGLITYHGRRIRRGFMTGIVLDSHVSDLHQYYAQKKGPALNQAAFIEALTSAVRHLHALGYAHNDINYWNVLVKSDGLPVLADFNACRPIGEKLTYTQGSEGWNDVPLDDYMASAIEHDLFGVKQIREWIEKQNGLGPDDPRPCTPKVVRTVINTELLGRY